MAGREKKKRNGNGLCDPYALVQVSVIIYRFYFFTLAKKSLTTHQRNMHGISPTGFMCHKCNKLLKSKEEEIKHEQESHGKDLFCEKCNIAFENLMSFNDHLNVCLDEPKNFNCKKCNNPRYGFT